MSLLEREGAERISALLYSNVLYLATTCLLLYDATNGKRYSFLILKFDSAAKMVTNLDMEIPSDLEQQALQTFDKLLEKGEILFEIPRTDIAIVNGIQVSLSPVFSPGISSGSFLWG